MEEDTTSLPNQDDQSDSGMLSDYVVRITSCDKFTSEQLLTFIEQEFQICRYVIGRETVPQEHFHLVLSVDVSVTEEDLRSIIKSFLIPFWTTEENKKLPRGWGNKQYNLQVCEDLNKSVSYAVKLGEIWYEGFDEDYINARKTESFLKPSDFKTEYKLLCELFSTTQMTIHEFMISFVRLKSKYGQQVVMSQAYGYALSNLIKREPAEAENYVENYLYKQ